MKRYKLSDIFFALSVAFGVVAILWIEGIIIKMVYDVEGTALAVLVGLGIASLDCLFAAFMTLE